MQQSQILRFKDKDAVLEAFRSHGLTAVSVGPYLIGVADPSVLSSPEKLAAYIRENLGNRDKMLFFTKGRQPGLYNQVAAHSEILTRAEKIEGRHMAIRILPREAVPVPVEQPLPRPVRTEAPPTPRRRGRRRTEEPAEEAPPAPTEEAPQEEAPPEEAPTEEAQEEAAPEEAPAEEAPPEAVPVGEAQAVKVSQVRLSFRFQVDEYALSNALRAAGLYDKARRELSLGSRDVSHWNVFMRTGLDLNGASAIVFKIDSMVEDGIISEDEATRLHSLGQLPLTLLGALISRIEEKGGDPNKYAYIVGREQVDILAFYGAVEFLRASVPALVAKQDAIMEEFSRRRGVLQELVSDYDSILDQLAGKPSGEEATVTAPSGAERSGKVSDLVDGFKEDKGRAERELESLLRFMAPGSVGRIINAEIAASFF